jgi:lysozyme
MTRPVPAILGPFLDAAEARRSKSYRDSKGVWTIGVGHTGPEVTPGLMWNNAQIDAARDADAEHAADRLCKAVKASVIAGLTDHQYSALISFVFNMGLDPGWTIWKRLNAGALAAVPKEMRRFNKIKHEDGTVEVLPGLTNRRAAEEIFWNTPDDQHPVDAIAAAGAVASPPSSMTRNSITPPEVADAKPLVQSKSFMGACTAAVLGGVNYCAEHLPGVKDAAKGVADQLDPLTGGSHMAAQAHSLLTTVVAAIVIGLPVLIWLGKRRA